MTTKKINNNNIFSGEYSITDAPLNYNYSYNSVTNKNKDKEIFSYNDNIEELKVNINNIIKANRNRTTDFKKNNINRSNNKCIDIEFEINNNKKYENLRNKTNNFFYPKKHKRNSFFIEHKNQNLIEIVELP